MDESTTGEDLLERVRQARFGDGLCCVRCGSHDVCRWGRHADRQRYRCGGCRRTFSDLTGTPAAYSKHLDAWAPQLRLMGLSEPARSTARMLGVGEETVRRWRRRVLDTLQHDVPRVCSGRVQVGRALGVGGGARLMLVAVDSDGRAMAHCLQHVHDLHLLRSVLAAHVAPGSTIICLDAPRSPIARAARMAGLAYVRAVSYQPLDADAATTRELQVHVRRLRRWLRRFCGIPAISLERYLTWYEILRRGPSTGDGAAGDALIPASGATALDYATRVLRCSELAEYFLDRCVFSWRLPP
jgi:transposase-like protein